MPFLIGPLELFVNRRMSRVRDCIGPEDGL